MNDELLKWYVYDVTASESALNGVQMRGRTRKFAVENGINLLIENTEDIANAVRFAVLNENDAELITKFIHSVAADAHVTLTRQNVPNPVLSKITVNNLEKYSI